MAAMTYRITACTPMDDGRVLDCTDGAVLGDAYGTTYYDREEAEQAAQELRDGLADTDLDPATEYSVEEDGEVETEPHRGECLRCGLTADREMVIGETEHASKRATDACPRCGSRDARWVHDPARDEE